MDFAFAPGPIGRDSYPYERDKMLTHPSRAKSGPTLVDMNKDKEPMAVEITVDRDTMFRTQNPVIAKAFLGALGQREVRMLCPTGSVTTGADIALMLLERAAA